MLLAFELQISLRLQLALSRGVLAPSLLALLNHFAQIRHWAYFERSILHSRMFGHELNCVIQISRFQYQNAAQLLLRLRVRTVGHCNFAVLPIEGHRRIRGLKSFAGGKVPVLPQLIA
jgi:hypothetical protein